MLLARLTSLSEDRGVDAVLCWSGLMMGVSETEGGVWPSAR